MDIYTLLIPVGTEQDTPNRISDPGTAKHLIKASFQVLDIPEVYPI